MSTNVLIAEFTATTPGQRDQGLTKALSVAKTRAARDGKSGILITRHHFRRFSVTLTPAVPYGSIHERDYAQR